MAALCEILPMGTPSMVLQVQIALAGASQVLCLGDEEGVAIVKDALKQVIEVHREYGIPFFHIGADEAFEFGVCQKSLDWIKSKGQDGGKQGLALSHLKNIATYVKELTGEGTTVLAWHDMLKDFEGRLIKKLELGGLIEPVIWDYSETIVTMNDWSFSTIADNFPVVWASSAYKGANFPSAKYIDIRHYETNNLAWISTKQQQQRKFKKFHGIIVTGWQRYDHMAALCEILPMGTPSMVLFQIALAGASQVLCLGDEEGVAIVKDALKQVIEVHREYGIPFFHIGADEAFEFGVCQKSLDWIKSKGQDGGKQGLALSHLKNIATYVKELTGEGTTVLAWHDMLKDFEGRLIKKLELGGLIEPVIWDYSETIVTMNDWSFSTIADNFPVVWASSAYKGANFPSAKYIDIRHYETNNLAWISTKQQQQRKFKKFHGIIVTGWQRYDHMAALCEILPMGTPSMVLFQIALAGASQDQNAVRAKAAEVLGCSSYQVAGLNLINNQCTFPGFGVYQLFQGKAQQTIANIDRELDSNHHIMGWLSPYSQRHNFSQNWYLGQIQGVLTNLHSQAESVETAIRKEMEKLFFENTIDEFLYLGMAPTTDKLVRMLKEAERLKKLSTYPKRHFKIVREEL